MAVKLLLDTNAYSALARGNAVVAEYVQNAEQLVLSSVMIGELLHGFCCGDRLEANFRQSVNCCASRATLISCYTR